MAQDIISIAFDTTQADALRTAVADLRTQLGDKTLALTPDQRQELLKMGTKSENFVRQALTALDKNRQVVPPSLGLDAALQDLATLDLLRPVLQELEQVVERLRDTDMALGSDLMDTAVEGYSLLKVTGANQGLDGLVRELGERFDRSSAETAAPPAKAPVAEPVSI